MAQAEKTTIARPYARAAFAVGLDSDELPSWSNMLSILAFASSQEAVRQALDDPQLTRREQADLLVRVCGEDLNDNARNLVSVLAEHGRTGLLEEIARLFDGLRAAHEKTVDVEIISAFDVSDEDRRKLQTGLKERLKRDVNIEARVDKELLGGVIIRAEDTVIDNSIRGKLAKLAQVMSQ